MSRKIGFHDYFKTWKFGLIKEQASSRYCTVLKYSRFSGFCPKSIVSKFLKSLMITYANGKFFGFPTNFFCKIP